MSEHFKVFHNRSEMEMRLASDKLREQYRDRRRNATLYGKRLAEFILSHEGADVLRDQRLCDHAEHLAEFEGTQKTGDSNAATAVEQNGHGQTFGDVPEEEHIQPNPDDIKPFEDL